MGMLDERVALVTGAGSPTGIGFSTARVFGREGAMLAIASTTERIRDRESDLAGEGFTVAGFTADLTDAGEAAALVEAIEDLYGRVDVLVNNAGMVQVGVVDDAHSFVDTSEASFERDLALNLKTAFNVTRPVLVGMIERGYGRVVNVSSVTGPFVANPESAGYSAAKAAMDGLMRAIALESARHGITVNSVAPGWIETGSSLPEELIAGRHTPIGRAGRPEEVAELIAFL